jgi:hypothetical protein
MQEREVEQFLRDKCKEAGLLCWKMQSLSIRGFPDRMVVCPDGRIYFVEVKGDGGRLSQLQKVVIDRLRSNKCNVFVVTGIESVKAFLSYVSTGNPDDLPPA